MANQGSAFAFHRHPESTQLNHNSQSKNRASLIWGFIFLRSGRLVRWSVGVWMNGWRDGGVGGGGSGGSAPAQWWPDSCTLLTCWINSYCILRLLICPLVSPRPYTWLSFTCAIQLSYVHVRSPRQRGHMTKQHKKEKREELDSLWPH